MRPLSLTVGAVMVDRIDMWPLFRTGGIFLGLADESLVAGPAAASAPGPVLAVAPVNAFGFARKGQYTATLWWFGKVTAGRGDVLRRNGD